MRSVRAVTLTIMAALGGLDACSPSGLHGDVPFETLAENAAGDLGTPDSDRGRADARDGHRDEPADQTDTAPEGLQEAEPAADVPDEPDLPLPDMLPEVNAADAGCLADCTGKQCGSDGCGGSCGDCPPGLECHDAQCVECFDGNTQPWDGCDGGKIVEFQVNESSAYDQGQPSLAVLTDGGLVVTWDGTGSGDPEGIFGRRFDADGAALGGDFAINQETEGEQRYSRVAALAGGGFVVVWEGAGKDDEQGVHARVFAADATAPSSQFPLPPSPVNEQKSPWAAGLPGGGFVAVWSAFGLTGSNFGVLCRLFGADGAAVAPEFKVNVFVEDDQQYPTAAAFPDNRFVVAWQSKPKDGSSYGVFARLYAADGTPEGSEIPVNTDVQGTQWTPWIATHAGGFVVVWDGEGSGDDWGIFGRRFDPDGNPLGDQFPVNTTVEGEQWEASVAAWPDGRFAVAWESWHVPGQEGEVLLQRFATDGAAEGEESQINTETWDGQGDPSLAALPDGGLVAVWYSYLQDGSERGIFGQRFDSQGNKLVH